METSGMVKETPSLVMETTFFWQKLGAWTFWGERTRLACGFGGRARNSVGQISLTGFRRDAENGNRDIALPIPKSWQPM
jgi:hypothetical protein